MFQEERELSRLNDGLIAEQRTQALQQYLTTALDFISQLSSQIFGIQLQRLEQETAAELTAIDERTEQKLSSVEEGSNEETRILAEASAEKDEIEKAAARKEREIRIRQAIINTALAVGNALATVQPFIPAGIAAASIALARGVAEVNTIRSQTFAAGGFTGKGRGTPDHTGQIPVGVVHGDEYVSPKGVVEHPEARGPLAILERLRVKLGYTRRPAKGFYNVGGFVNGSTAPSGSSSSLTMSSFSVSASLSDENIEAIEGAVSRGSANGTERGSINGLQKGARLEERRRALDEKSQI